MNAIRNHIQPNARAFARHRLWVCFLLLLSTPSLSHAQLEGRFWYFGAFCGIDFLPTPPQSITDGVLNTSEGCSAISNRFGDLLFYTDGIKVLNRKHLTMKNGQGLDGNSSSTQSSIILPFYGDTSRYYIFTTDYQANANGLQYNVVDMSGDNGLGEVVTKNVSLRATTCEKLAITPHANGRDFWLMAHDYPGNGWTAFLITPTGISTSPLISYSGTGLYGGGLSTIGQAKFSADGMWLASGHDYGHFVEIFRFNNATGQVSSPTYIGYPNSYGLEFSPNSRFLYVNSKDSILQFDLQNPNSIAIRSSAINLGRGSYGAAQLALDGKMYLAVYGSRYLNCINYPDRKGAASNYQIRSLTLSAESRFGLPNYPALLMVNRRIVLPRPCVNESFVLSTSSLLPIDSVSWSVQPPRPGQDSLRASGDSMTLSYAFAGIYYVHCIQYASGLAFHLHDSFNVSDYPIVNLGRDTSICTGEAVTLDLSKDSFDLVLWDNNSTNQKREDLPSGKYWVTVFNRKCSSSDTITVHPLSRVVTQLQDASLCPGQVHNVNLPEIDSVLYLWSDGFLGRQRQLSDTGTYIVSSLSKFSCQAWSDTFTIKSRLGPAFRKSFDTIVCAGTPLTFDFSGLKLKFFDWDDGIKDSIRTITKAGKYTILVTNACFLVDTVQIQVTHIHAQSPPSIAIGKLDCINGTITLRSNPASNALLSWDQKPFDTAQSYTTLSKPARSIPLIIAFPCDTFYTDFVVHDTLCDCPYFIPNAFHPFSAVEANKGFSIAIGCPYSSFQVQFYNRWGQFLATSTDPNHAWDGLMHNGYQCPEGVYLYIVQFLKQDGSWARESGLVHLLH